QPPGCTARRAREAQHVPHQRPARGGARLEVRHRPVREARGGVGGDADQRSSRLNGSVMQRGPPPPRTSSLPSIVTTPRSPSPSALPPSASRSAAGTILNPACSSSRSVAALRSYVVPTTGRKAKELLADDHCSGC